MSIEPLAEGFVGGILGGILLYTIVWVMGRLAGSLAEIDREDQRRYEHQQQQQQKRRRKSEAEMGAREMGVREFRIPPDVCAFCSRPLTDGALGRACYNYSGNCTGALLWREQHNQQQAN